jgi:hypothetical protein
MHQPSRPSFLLLVAGLALAAVPAAAVPLCGAWQLVPTPNVGNSVTRLTAVTALSADDAWAVGLWRSTPAGGGPLVLHWNGVDWTDVEPPETGQFGSEPSLTGIDAAPNGDVWIGGHVRTGYPTDQMPLVMRWRNGTWDSVETVTLRPQTEYPFAARGGQLDEVDALAPDDIWAVGLAAGMGDASATVLPLVVHWDGSAWTEAELPPIANRWHHLLGVAAIAADDVWAVGEYRNIGGLYHGVTYHWDGAAWSHVWSPIEAMASGTLSDVVALGPDDVWAAGVGDSGPAMMHWDGSEWSLVPTPANMAGTLAVLAPDDIWAPGWNGYHHWDGVEWTEVLAPVPGASFVIRNGGTAIVAGCDVWSVGFWTLADGLTSFTLAERLRAEPTSASASPGDAPAAFAAITATPNPFNPQVELSFVLPQLTGADICIYNLNGERVRTLWRGESASGRQILTWDGRDDAGGALASGVYLVQLATDQGQVSTAKITLVK